MDVGALQARIIADTSNFDKGIARAQAAVSNFQKNTFSSLAATAQKFRTFGYLASTAVTLPIVMAGKAVVNMAKDYEFSMQKIVGLAGVAQDAVNKWNKELLTLAPNVAKGPKELAEALYFISSSGIKGAQAMDVLTLSARAAASGLGETQAVANLLTSVLLAYAGTSMTAAKATDILVAAVREGKAEASGFSSAVGSIIPLASEMGVSFDQVAGGMAAITLTGSTAAQAAVYLKGVFNSLLKSTMQGEKALNSMGSSYQELRDILRNQGLIALMQKVRDMSVEYGETLASDVFPNIRGLTAYLSISGKNFKYNQEMMQRVTNSAGSMNSAWGAVADTIQIRFNVAMAKVNVSMISLGKSVSEVIIPILNWLSKTLANITEWFNGLSEAWKRFHVIAAMITAALGPLALITSLLLYTVNGLKLFFVWIVTKGLSIVKTITLWANAFFNVKKATDAVAVSTKALAIINTTVTSQESLLVAAKLKTAQADAVAAAAAYGNADANAALAEAELAQIGIEKTLTASKAQQAAASNAVTAATTREALVTARMTKLRRVGALMNGVYIKLYTSILGLIGGTTALATSTEVLIPAQAAYTKQILVWDGAVSGAMGTTVAYTGTVLANSGVMVVNTGNVIANTQAKVAAVTTQLALTAGIRAGVASQLALSAVTESSLAAQALYNQTLRSRIAYQIVLGSVIDTGIITHNAWTIATNASIASQVAAISLLKTRTVFQLAFNTALGIGAKAQLMLTQTTLSGAAAQLLISNAFKGVLSYQLMLAPIYRGTASAQLMLTAATQVSTAALTTQLALLPYIATATVGMARIFVASTSAIIGTNRLFLASNRQVLALLPHVAASSAGMSTIFIASTNAIIGTNSAYVTSVRGVNAALGAQLAITERASVSNLLYAATMKKQLALMPHITTASVGVGRVFVTTADGLITTSRVFQQTAKTQLALMPHMATGARMAAGQAKAYAAAQGLASTANRSFIAGTGAVMASNRLFVAGSGKATIGQKLFTTVQIAATAASSFFTKTLAGATVAMRAFASTAATALIVTGIGVIIAGIVLLISHLLKAKKAKKELAEIERIETEARDNTSASIAKETFELSVLIESLKDSNVPLSVRAKLIQEFNDKYGEYLGYLIDENTGITELTSAYDKLVPLLQARLNLEGAIAAAGEASAEKAKTDASILALQTKRLLLMKEEDAYLKAYPGRKTPTHIGQVNEGVVYQRETKEDLKRAWDLIKIEKDLIDLRAKGIKQDEYSTATVENLNIASVKKNAVDAENIRLLKEKEEETKKATEAVSNMTKEEKKAFDKKEEAIALLKSEAKTMGETAKKKKEALSKLPTDWPLYEEENEKIIKEEMAAEDKATEALKVQIEQKGIINKEWSEKQVADRTNLVKKVSKVELDAYDKSIADLKGFEAEKEQILKKKETADKAVKEFSDYQMKHPETVTDIDYKEKGSALLFTANKLAYDLVTINEQIANSGKMTAKALATNYETVSGWLQALRDEIDDLGKKEANAPSRAEANVFRIQKEAKEKELKDYESVSKDLLDVRIKAGNTAQLIEETAVKKLQLTAEEEGARLFDIKVKWMKRDLALMETTGKRTVEEQQAIDDLVAQINAEELDGVLKAKEVAWKKISDCEKAQNELMANERSKAIEGTLKDKTEEARQLEDIAIGLLQSEIDIDKTKPGADIHEIGIRQDQLNQRKTFNTKEFQEAQFAKARALINWQQTAEGVYDDIDKRNEQGLIFDLDAEALRMEAKIKFYDFLNTAHPEYIKFIESLDREQLNTVIENIDKEIAKKKKAGATEIELEQLKQDKIDALAKKRAKSREDRQKESWERMNDAINESVSSLNSRLVGGFAESIGNAISGLDDPFNNMRGIIAEFLIDLGKALIAVGTLTKAFQELIKTPEGAIIAIGVGIAAVIAGTILKNKIAEGPKPMADGGLLYGPTNVLAGEYEGARNNPEVFSPLSDLKNMLQPDYPLNERLVAEISGRKLQLILTRESDYQNRGKR